jgi:hypothetical protein
MKEVERRSTRDAREQPEPKTPDRRHQQDGEQIRHAVRFRRRDLPQREDQRRDRRHGHRRDHEPGE